MDKEYNPHKKAKLILSTALITLIALFFLFPLVWMIVSSMKAESSIYKDMTSWRAFAPSWNVKEWVATYTALFNRFDIFRYIGNSVLYASCVTVGSIVINSLAGYGFARFKFKGKKLLFGLLLATLVIPGETILIQQFQIAKSLGILNSIIAVILPGMASPFYIYMFKNFFESISDDVMESAQIEGANALQIYWKVMLPMAKPAIATVGTLTFIGSWNDYIWPLMVLTDSEKFPLQVAITNINNTQPVYMNQVMALLTISTVPLVIIYVIFQKYLVQGMGASGTGVK
ncbi:carbohydrate ABC transporter permease [Ligilactobacillus equi]